MTYTRVPAEGCVFANQSDLGNFSGDGTLQSPIRFTLNSEYAELIKRCMNALPVSPVSASPLWHDCNAMLKRVGAR